MDGFTMDHDGNNRGGNGKERSIDERISEICIAIGISPKNRGYRYLREGVRLAILDPTIMNHVTKVLYPAIATQFSTTASKVERAIRHAIETAWNRERVDVIKAIFGARVYFGVERPTNSELIALIADKLMLEDLR